MAQSNMYRKPLPKGAAVHPSIAIATDIYLEKRDIISNNDQHPPPYVPTVAQELDQKPALSIDTKHTVQTLSARIYDNHQPSAPEAALNSSSFPFAHSNELLSGRGHGDVSPNFSTGTHNQNPADVFFGDTSPLEVNSASTADTESPTGGIERKPKSSKLMKAFEETSHFLGGLITHPVESTKHFSILRHSHGIVYYKGPATSIAITVFSDQPLPSDRRYWLQLKGWSGQTGMKLKAMIRTNSSWVNVTPVISVQPADLPPLDERAWQRDIKKFQSKTTKAAHSHTVRETAILRVPSEASDGYFRVVLTKGSDRSVLCPSPVFRLASTSMSAGSLKGASLATLPIELGINIMQFAARQVTTNIVTPYTELAQQGVSKVVPQTVSNYAPLAYSLLGAEGFVDSVNEQYGNARTEQALLAGANSEQYIPLQRPQIEGDDEGPADPFPFTLTSKIIRGAGQDLERTGMPTANLGLIPADQIITKSGVFFGWAFITPDGAEDGLLHTEWRHAIISIDHIRSERAQVAPRKAVKAYLLHNFEGHEFVGSKIELIIMGYLRPIIESSNKEAYFTETLRDIEMTRDSLDRVNWTPEQVQLQLKQVKSGRSLLECGAAVRLAAQRTVDRVPMHVLGVRTESTRLNDRGMFGNGGIYVSRDGLNGRRM